MSRAQSPYRGYHLRLSETERGIRVKAYQRTTRRERPAVDGPLPAAAPAHRPGRNFRTDGAALFAFLLLLLLGTAGAQPLPPDHPKTVAARRVVDDLVRAIGDGRTPPEFQLLASGSSSRMKVAWFAPGHNLLTLEERAYDLCAELGPDSLNGLAVLLGHELAHYYKDHGWVGDFGNGFAELEVGQTLNQLRRSEEKVLELETEADIFGGFFGYVAGYNTLEAAPPLLEKLYTAYALSTQLRGYPALPERQAIARQSAAELRGLIPAFEAGQRLLLVRQS